MPGHEAERTFLDIGHDCFVEQAINKPKRGSAALHLQPRKVQDLAPNLSAEKKNITAMAIMYFFFMALQECQCHWTPMQRSFMELRMNASKSWNSFQNRKHHELSEKQKKSLKKKKLRESKLLLQPSGVLKYLGQDALQRVLKHCMTRAPQKHPVRASLRASSKSETSAEILTRFFCSVHCGRNWEISN